MPNSILNFLKYHTLLESYFIIKFPEHVAVSKDKFPTKTNFKDAFSENLEVKYPFSKIDWDIEPFSKFRILVDAPPKPLKKNDKNQFEFADAISVSSWDELIDSYRQLRNNITHGAKFLTMQLGNRDIKLSNAGIEFIKFLNNEKLIDMREWVI